MQHDEEYIIDSLGIASWSPEKQQPAIVEATMRIGTALIDQLSEQQYTEYKAIVDNNESVIHAWLDQNIPDYRENEAYKQMAAGYDSDPEKNSPEKLLATVAWLQVNVPNLQSVIDETLEHYKQEVLSNGA